MPNFSSLKSKFDSLKQKSHKPALILPGRNIIVPGGRIGKIGLAFLIGIIPALLIVIPQSVPNFSSFVDRSSSNFLNIHTLVGQQTTNLPATSVQTLVTKVSDCDKVAKELRFSCFRSAVDKYYQGKPADETYSLQSKLNFHSDDTSYAIFGTNCHTYYHALGDYIATHSPTEPDPADKLSACPQDCTSGCTMGLYKRLALENNYALPYIKNLYDICRDGEGPQCSHEIGHILHDKYTTAVLKTLDEISLKDYGLKQSKDYIYTSLNSADLNRPFEDCKAIVKKDDLGYCYSGIGHNLFLYSEFSPGGYKAQFDECGKIAATNRDSCLSFLLFRIGINGASPDFLSNKFDEGNKICDDAAVLINRPDLVKHCYRGLGGGIGLFIDSENSTSAPASSLEEIKLLDRAALCDQVPSEFIDTCYAGVLGTRFKDLYLNFKYKYPPIDKVLGPIEKSGDSNKVVG